ncbi:MAG: hypothetical protein PHS48_02035 [Bacteroidales bacterium]|nr:hypothetical protein [Bacteroidales bacterium]
MKTFLLVILHNWAAVAAISCLISSFVISIIALKAYNKAVIAEEESKIKW